MKSNVKFKAIVHAEKQTDITENVNQSIINMRRNLPTSVDINYEIKPNDRSTTIGAGYKSEVTGYFILEDGEISIDELLNEGKACFNDTFEILSES